MPLQPLSLTPPTPPPLIDVDEILMLWLLAGAQPAPGREGGLEKSMPRGGGGTPESRAWAPAGSVLPC